LDEDQARSRALDAAEALFYARGVQAVGMDAVRDRSGLTLRRLYGLFPAKEHLVVAFLERRDVRWRRRLADHVEREPDPRRRPLAVFDWLELWFREPGFRGCAWINTFGELGGTSTAVADQARDHKARFRDYLAGLVAAAGGDAGLTDGLLLLAEGAMVTAGITGSAEPARQARSAAGTLIAAAGAAA
jgi:AcrR family transcriptional regulator